MKKNINLFVLGAVILTIALFGCGSGKATDTTASEKIDGVALYSSYCGGCHGPLATSGKKGATPFQIQNAISHNFGGMGAFADLSPEQLQAIMTALSDAGAATSPTITTNATDTTASPVAGAALYKANCASCHGALAMSSMAGATASMIQMAISNNYGGMRQFSNLTFAEIQSIASALAPITAPTTAPTPAQTGGAALYTTYCSSCHGSLAASSKAGRTAAQIQTALGSVGQMSSLSFLTATQVQAIAAALATAPALSPTDGVGQYTSNCSSCHGALASSSVGGASASTIQSAIASQSRMNSLSSLTSTQIQAIANALSTVAGGGGD